MPLARSGTALDTGFVQYELLCPHCIQEKKEPDHTPFGDIPAEDTPIRLVKVEHDVSMATFPDQLPGLTILFQCANGHVWQWRLSFEPQSKAPVGQFGAVYMSEVGVALSDLPSDLRPPTNKGELPPGLRPLDDLVDWVEEEE